MRLLVDADLSPVVADALREVGHDVTHVADLGLHTATDETIFRVATEEQYVIVTADSDTTRDKLPAVIRGEVGARPAGAPGRRSRATRPEPGQEAAARA
ncbi:MAG: DUF5615 family PIN-like protein [Dermatophilaceae bacterium]